MLVAKLAWLYIDDESSGSKYSTVTQNRLASFPKCNRNIEKTVPSTRCCRRDGMRTAADYPLIIGRITIPIGSSVREFGSPGSQQDEHSGGPYAKEKRSYTLVFIPHVIPYLEATSSVVFHDVARTSHLKQGASI